MTRQRWFCSYCGAVTPRMPDARDGRVRCRAHAALPVEDENTWRPPQDLQGCYTTGLPHDAIPPDVLEKIVNAARMREDSPPTKGTEA